MEFSRPEIKVLEELANGNKTIKSIASALKKSDKQIYVTAKKLSDKGIIERAPLQPKKITFVSLLLQQLSQISDVATVLSDSGIPILIAVLEPATIQEIIQATGFKKTIVYKKIEEARARSIIRKTNSRFGFNPKLWSNLREFLIELKKFEQTTDERIPVGSIIYYKNKNEIVFSSKEELNASETAFSAFKDFGIEILTITNFYYLPKKQLTKMDIMNHSLFIADKERDARLIIFIALFYAKYRKELSRVKHDIRKNLDKIFEGEHIAGFPTLAEIRDRADVYEIKV